MRKHCSTDPPSTVETTAAPSTLAAAPMATKDSARTCKAESRHEPGFRYTNCCLIFAVPWWWQEQSFRKPGARADGFWNDEETDRNPGNLQGKGSNLETKSDKLFGTFIICVLRITTRLLQKTWEAVATFLGPIFDTCSSQFAKA